MKNAMKRWATFALCCVLVLALAACGPGGDAPSQGAGGKGRYVESDITPPGLEGEALASFLAADGTLLCYTQSLERMFISADGGENWTESEGPGANGKLPGRVDAINLLADGSLLAAAYSEDGQTLTGLIKIRPDGTVVPFPVPALEEAIATGDTTYIDLLQPLSADRLFLSFTSGDFGAFAGADDSDDASDAGADSDADGDDASQSGGGALFSSGQQTRFNGLVDLTTGEVVAEFPELYSVAATAGDDTLYLLSYGGKISAFSLADGSAKSAGGQISVEEFAFGMAFAYSQGTLYVLDGKRVQKVNGTTTETLIDGGSYTFSDPDCFPAGMHVLESGEIVLNLRGRDGHRLYKYTWDENAETDPAQVLKVWSLRENYMVRAAIGQLRRQNPNITVEYEVALQGEGGMTAEDAIKNLNTRLLAGNGPDVMILDGCPADSYAARGILQDLNGLVDTAGMFQNLAAPFVGEEGTFVLPMNVKIPLLLGTEEDLAKADTLAKLAAMVAAGNALPVLGNNDDVFASLAEEKRPVLALDDLKEIFTLLWNTNAGAIIHDGALDSAALRDTLAALSQISDKYGLGSGGGTGSGAVAMMSDSGASATVTGSVLGYASRRAVLGAYSADDMQMMQLMLDPPGSEYTAFPGLMDGSFVPVTMVGIGAGSDKTSLAAEFLKTMLSEDVQGIRTGAGFPVTEAGIQKQIADIDDMMRQNRDESFAFDYAPLMALAKTPMLADDVVKDMVWNAAQNLCTGKTDLDAAVTQLEQNLTNYLAERQ